MKIQFNKKGELRHLLTLDGVKYDQIIHILDLAESYFLPNGQIGERENLKGKTVANLFFETSTRTRTTFEIAAKKLGAQALNFNVSQSATSKGETLYDTIRNLEAMQCDLFVIRHQSSGAAHFITQHVEPSTAVINAGDGRHAHPTQALLDIFTIRKHHKTLQNLRVAIVGDVLHSRVARSQIQALTLLRANEIRIIAPKTLLPPFVEQLGVKVFHDLKEGLKEVDVIIMLRLQLERMEKGLIPKGSAYFREYGLTTSILEEINPHALVIHPGPMNRDVEIQSEVADKHQNVILDQVTNGIAIRMAVMSHLKANL